MSPKSLDVINKTSVLLMAKSGSQRLPNKNLTEFGFEHNKTTLLEWKICQLLEVFPGERIILSSDSDAYLNLGARFNLTLHKREKELTDFGSFAENLRSVAKKAKTDLVMYANGPCNPLIGPKRIVHFLESVLPQFLDEGVFAVEQLKGFHTYRESWLNFEPGENHLGSERLLNPSRICWALTIRNRDKIIADGSMLSKFNSPYVVPNWAATDIDYLEDLHLAERYLDKYLEYEST